METKKKKSTKNPNEMARFSCGFYNYDINDIVLLNILNGKAPKHLRGNEIKKMALAYLKSQEPELFNAVYKEVSNMMGISTTITGMPTEIVVPTKVEKKEAVVETEENTVVTTEKVVEEAVEENEEAVTTVNEDEIEEINESEPIKSEVLIEEAPKEIEKDEEVPAPEDEDTEEPVTRARGKKSQFLKKMKNSTN